MLVRLGWLSENFLYDLVFFDFSSADWAKSLVALVFFCFDETLDTFSVVLVGLETGKLANLVTNNIIFEANLALIALQLGCEHANHGLGESLIHDLSDGGAHAVDLSSAASFSLLSDGLSDDSETSHALELGATSPMVDEVVELSQFKFDVVQTDDSLFEVVLLADGLVLVAAAGEDGVNDEEGDADDDEDWVLKKVQNQHCVQYLNSLILLLSVWEKEVLLLKFITLFIKQVNGDSDDDGLHDPFQEC